MGSAKRIASNGKIPIFLIFVATFICSIQSGALRWQDCLIPLVLLCVAALFNKFKSTGIVTDILIFVSLGSCITSVFLTKSDMQEAIHEALKYFCFAAAFYASVSVPKRNIYKTISIIGVFLAVSGLLAYCNIIRLSELVFNDRGILRLQSFIKYANTTSAFLGCAYFCLCGVKIKNQTLSGMFKMLILSAFYLTVSKAAIPIFLCIGILYMIKNKDSGFFVHNAVCFLFVIPAIYLTGHKMFSQCMLLIILWVVVGSLLSGRLRYSKKLSSICILGATLAIAAAAYLMISGKYDIFSTFTYRLKYMKDALKLINGGLFGNGPTSWKLLQFGVQQEQYNVTYIHNGWLQFLVENGIIFTIAFAGIVLISIIRMFKSRSFESIAGVVFIALHSFIDINFGFAIILIILGLLCGCDAKCDKKNILSVLIFVLCIASAIYGSADYFARINFEKAYISQNNSLALKNAYRLEKICPKDSSVQINIALLSGENMNTRLEKALKLNPYDQSIVTRYAEYLISNNDSRALEYLKKLLIMAPRQESTYTSVRQLAQQALIYNAVTEAEYEDFLIYTDSCLEQNGVVDRNRQLEDIAK